MAKKCEICNASGVHIEEFSIGDVTHTLCWACIRKHLNEVPKFPKHRKLKSLFCNHDNHVIYDFCRGDIPGTKHIAWLCKDCGKIYLSTNV